MPRIIPYSAGLGLRVKDCDTNSFSLRGGFRGGFFDIIRGMRHCRADIPNRCCHLTSRVNRRAVEGVQAANRRNLGSVPNRWLGGSVVRWLGSCANPQPETHTSRPENEGLVPKVPILKYRIILRGQANIMQIACAVAGSVPKFSFDYTEEDHRLGSSPYLPWGIWKHFRSREELEDDLKKAISECNPTAFQRLMHQYQDTRTHYDKGYRWWTLGHAKDGTEPDKDDKAWEAAEKDTVVFVKQWTESCQLTNECTCAWGKK